MVARNPDLARNIELERAILENPDSEDAYLVLGDWLQAQGDPLGELIAVHARSQTERADELIATHKTAWLGEHLASLEAAGELSCKWRWGFLERLTAGGDERSDADAVATYEAILAAPAARFLRQLELRVFADLDYQPLIAAMARLGLPPALERLAITTRKLQDGEGDLGEIAALYPLLGKVTDLEIEAGEFELGRIDLPHLWALNVGATGELRLAHLAAVLDAPWPNLEWLTLMFGWNRDEQCSLEDLAPLIAGTSCPILRHLVLQNPPSPNELVAELVSSKLLAGLKSLEISFGLLGTDGVNCILANKDRFAHLEALAIPGNSIRPAEAEALKAAFGEMLDLGNQFPPPEPAAPPPPEPTCQERLVADGRWDDALAPASITLPVYTTNHLAFSPDLASIALLPLIEKPPHIQVRSRLDGSLRATLPLVGEPSFHGSEILWVADAIIHLEFHDETVPNTFIRHWRVVRHRQRGGEWVREELAAIDGFNVNLGAIPDGFIIVGPGFFRRGTADGPLGEPISHPLLGVHGGRLLATEPSSGRIVVLVDYGKNIVVFDPDFAIVAELEATRTVSTAHSGAWFCGPNTLIVVGGRSLSTWRVEGGQFIEQGRGVYLSEPDQYYRTYSYPLGVTVFPSRRLVAYPFEATTHWFAADTLESVTGPFRGEDCPVWISPDERYVVVPQYQSLAIFEVDALVLRRLLATAPSAFTDADRATLAKLEGPAAALVRNVVATSNR